MLCVWLPLNGDLHNQGLSDITVTNNGATINNNGKIGKCYQFGTAASDITIPATAMTSFTTECSVAFWINFLTWNTSYATFFQAGPASTPWTSYIFGFLRNNAASTCCFTISNGSSASNASYLTSVFDLNKWYHVTLIYKTGKCQIYINGILDHEYNTSIVPDFTKITTIKLGRSTNGSSYQTNCLMNDFRIYDHALSAKEVEEIAKGLVLHYKLDNNGLGNSNLIANSKQGGSWTYASSGYDRYAPTTLVIPSGDVYTLSFEAKSTVNGDKMRTHYYSPNTTTICISSQGITKTASDGHMDFTLTTTWTRYWVTYYQSATTAVKHLICPRLLEGQGTGTVSVRNVKFEEGSVATPWIPATSDAIYSQFIGDTNIIYDSSGYGNNGVITGSLETVTPSPRYSCATKFDGVSRITHDTLPSIYTLSCWCKTDKNKSTSQFMVADSGSHMCISFYNGTIIGVFGTTRSTGSKCTLGSEYKENDWNHIVVVKTSEDGQRDIYCNGVKLTPTSNDYWSATTGFWVGTRNASQGNPFYGDIADVRAYATALTPEQVKELYNTSMSIDASGNIHARELVEL